MVRAIAVVPAVLLLCAALSGCAVLDGGGGGQAGTLVRLVDLRLDPDAFEDEPEDLSDVLRALGTTRFEYTHDSDAVDTADVDVEYTDDDGREREAPLSDFTSADRLGRGDRVTIDGVLMTSQVRLTHGGDTLAKRGTAPGDWLEVGGYPLPMAAEAGARAAWSIAGGVEANAHLDRIGGTTVSNDMDYVCSPGPEPECSYQSVQLTETMRVTDANLHAGSTLDGQLSIDVSGSDSDPIVRLGVDGAVALNVEAGAHYFMQSTGHADPAEDDLIDADVGFDVDVQVDGDGALTFRFRDGDLRRVGAEGEVHVSGDVTAWDDQHPRSAAYHPIDIDGTDESFPYEEEDADVPSDPVDAVAEAMADLWRMDLQAGDEFRLATGALEEGIPTLTYVVRVVEEQRLTVPAGTFDTWHVATTANVAIDMDGHHQEFDLPAVDTWLDRDSGVPVASQQTFAMSLDLADVQALIDLAREAASEEGGSFEAPQDFRASLSGKPRMELTEWEDGLEMAPLASLLSPVWGVAGGFFFGVGYAGMGAFGAFDDAYEDEYGYESTPNMAFSLDRHDGGGDLTVVHTSSEVWWYDLDVRVDQGFCDVPGGQAVPGDIVTCTGSGSLRVVHLPSKTLLYESYL